MTRRIMATVAGALAALVLSHPGEVAAAGFALIENSAQGMGNAFAGGGAVAEDGSGVWFNPASMSRLGSQMQAAGHFISPQFKFTDGGSTSAIGTPLLSGLGGNKPASPVDDGGSNAVVPNFYYVRQLDERVAFGLAVNAPFGLKTEYGSDWIGRYQAIKSEIQDINVNPALSYKVSDQLTLGAGVSVNYIHAELTRAIDFNGLCLASSPGATVLGCTGGVAGGPGQGANDGLARVSGDDFSFGFNLGLMYEWSDSTRFSVAYRSQVSHTLDGKGKFQVPDTISAVGPVDAALRAPFVTDGAKVSLTLPDSLSFSAYHRFHPKFALMADATWTDWSDVPQVFIVFDNPATAGGPSLEPLGWQDTWRLGLGLSYYHNERLTLRTGVAYDESPVPSAELRTARLPDNDRIWLSFGASYRFNDAMSADFGYTHLFINDTRINRTEENGTLLGTYDSDADIVSLQFNYRFN